MTNPRAGRSVRILLSTACLTLVLASCGDGGDDDTAAPTKAASEPSAPADSPKVPEDDSSLGLEDAAAAAVKAVANSSLLTIETEVNRTVWEATVVTRNGTAHEMLIAKADGSIVDGPTKQTADAADKAENRASIRAAKLDYKEAARAMSKAVPDARLMELSLDAYKDRITAWEGDLYRTDGITYSVTVDAKSGHVLQKIADTDD